jgi:hypothetical protein
MGQPTDSAEGVGHQRAALPLRVDDLDDVMRIGGMELNIKESFLAANKLLMTGRDVLTPDAFPISE